MRSEAAGDGFYRSPYTGTDYPRLQVITVAELLEGRSIAMPAVAGMDRTYRRAPRAKSSRVQIDEAKLF